MVDQNTGSSSVLRLEVAEASYDRNANNSVVAYNLWLLERGGSNQAWNGGSPGVPYEVSWHNVESWASGTFGFDFRPGGFQNVLIVSSSRTVAHAADGSRGLTIRGYIGYTGSSTAGGPTDVYMDLWLTQLNLAPVAPSNVTAARVSDTQANLTWTNGNGDARRPTVLNAIQKRVNDGEWVTVTSMGATTSASVAIAANEKSEFRLMAYNDQGWVGYGYPPNAVFTTPAAPSNITATKDAALDITVGLTENVGYAEYVHEVQHGVEVGGVITWDAGILATLASGVLTYKHVAPNAGQRHVYRVRAGNGALRSGWAESPVVQLLAAPAKPTIPALAAFANRQAVFRLPWVHNPIDSTPQTKYQWRWSSNGGAAWTTGAKTASVNQYHDFAANTWAANATVQFQVRTKGSYDSGADGDASYSPWADAATVSFKTLPTAGVTAPANGSNLNDSTVRANVSFAQAEGATFVKAQLELLQGATLLETLESTIQVGITFATPVANGLSYTVRARVQDSNGLWSAWASSTFNVVYLAPVPAVVTTGYLPDNGYGQINLTIAAPGAGQAAAATVTITRTINGVTETVVENYPAESVLTFLDTTPTIHGTNTYTVTTKSALGAQSTTTATLITTECRRAYLSKGAGFNNVVVFGANLEVSESLGVASDTIQAAGRTKPIGLYGVETSVQLKVKSFVFAREGFSTIDQLRAILLVPGKACYRDSSGRRVFGSVKGSVAYKKTDRGDLTFTLTETS